ncbi:MAG: hypothetical protein F6K24_02830 [Okeania sp. SIO2D1]|nr:hypothetical protein [Okeania sp. SIO2D1]
MEKNLITVTTVFDDSNQPFAAEIYQEKVIKMTSEEAFQKGADLLCAIAVAQAEFNILKSLVKKGFGNTKSQKNFVQKRKKLITQRPPLPDTINPIYGAKTNTPLVEYFLEDVKLTLHFDTANFHARSLIEVSEVVKTDLYLSSFMRDKINLTDKEIAIWLGDFRLYRDQTKLENLYGHS